MPAAARSKLCSSVSAWSGVFASIAYPSYTHVNMLMCSHKLMHSYIQKDAETHLNMYIITYTYYTVAGNLKKKGGTEKVITWSLLKEGNNKPIGYKNY